MMLRSNKNIQLWLFIFVLLYASCVRSSQEGEQGVQTSSAPKQVLKYYEQDSIKGLDPLHTHNRAEMWITTQLYNGLFALDENMELYADLVETFKIAEDSLSYTFVLRKDVTFHPNKAFKQDADRLLTAHDVVFSLNRLAKHTQTHYLSDYFLQNNILQKQSDTALQVLDRHTLKVYLNKPCPFFLQLLTLPQTYIISHKAYHFYKKNYARHPVGTGAFSIKHYEPNHFIKLQKYEHYFKKDLPLLDEVQISWRYTAQSAEIAFQRNVLDFFIKTNTQKEDSAYMRYFELFKTCFVKFNIQSENSVFGNKKTRQALAYNTSYQSLDSLMNGRSQKPLGLIPPLLPLSQENYLYKNTHKTDTSFRFTMGIEAKDSFIAHTLQQQWKQVDISVDIQKKDSSQDAYIMRYQGNYADMNVFFSKLEAPKLSVYDSLWGVCLSENNEYLRQASQQQLSQLILDESLALPLFYEKLAIKKQNHTLDLYVTPTNKLILEYVRVSH